MEENRELKERRCGACTTETPPLQEEELRRYYKQLEEGWEIRDDHHLGKTYNFKNFREALDFTVRVGEMSEEEGHHPEILLTWGKVKITIFTHVIDGLSENDFIWAAKADEVYEA